MESPHDAFSAQQERPPKADLAKRLLAYVIDAVVAGLAGALAGLLLPSLSGLVSASYFLVRDGLEFEMMHRRSFGKYVMKLRPVRLDGAPMDLETSIRRNWMFALGALGPTLFWLGDLAGWLSLAGGLLFFYEVYRVFSDPQGRRWGDDLAGTKVIEEDRS